MNGSHTTMPTEHSPAVTPPKTALVHKSRPTRHTQNLAQLPCNNMLDANFSGKLARLNLPFKPLEHKVNK
jgi:hypothetical protein